MTPRRPSYIKVGGQGRPNRAVPVKHVEDTPCPDSDGNHELTNAWAVTRCRWCLRDWPTLDAEIRRGAA